MAPINTEHTRRQRLLIADDSEINRSILADMLGEEYDILEAENGVEAVSALQKYRTEIDLVLLDIVMPEMDGFEVLSVMNRNKWIEDIPVIMISAETSPDQIERAYSLGVTDFITRPFNALVVHHRVVNTTLLYAKQKKLVGMVTDQIYEKERQNTLMIDILSHTVEFRNGESGFHVIHIRILTEFFLQQLLLKTDRYKLSPSDIPLISNASALHDIGKISIPDEILNKPGRFTNEEFAIMKTHTSVGAEMMANIPVHKDDPLVEVTQAICRWHHERWDGRGYPDGLKGDEIPIAAQVVALADVYDALTSSRVYKPPFSHEKAVEMILNGECGAFNPLLMEILEEASPKLPEVLQDGRTERRSAQMEMRSVAQEMHHYEELSASERTLQLLEHERMKYSFFAAMSQEVQFEYTRDPSMVILNAWGANYLGLKETVMDPLENPKIREQLSESNRNSLVRAIGKATPAQPMVRYECQISLDGQPRWCRIIARTTWSGDEPPQYTGVIGKAVDIHDSQMKLAALERAASHDTLTGLLNHASAKKRIMERLEDRESQFALVIFDLDYFKNANNTYGHAFGDEVLKFLAGKIRDSIRGADIAARVGGDEFLLFLEYRGNLEPIIARIFNSISGSTYEHFPISLSMGVARTEEVGPEYDNLFHAADQALYQVKRSGRGRYTFYDETMRDMLSVISSIESDHDRSEDAAGLKGDN